MSIKLSVYPWCENCPDFSPDVDVHQGYDGFGNSVLCDTIIACENERRCLEIKKYLENESRSAEKISISKGEKK